MSSSGRYARDPSIGACCALRVCIGRRCGAALACANPAGAASRGGRIQATGLVDLYIAQSRIVQASIDEMERLGAPLADRPQWREELETVIRDVGKSQSLAGVYTPGQGAVFYHDEVQTGHVDEELARYFFGIWLDPRTSDPALRTALLGGSP